MQSGAHSEQISEIGSGRKIVLSIFMLIQEENHVCV